MARISSAARFLLVPLATLLVFSPNFQLVFASFTHPVENCSEEDAHFWSLTNQAFQIGDNSTNVCYVDGSAEWTVRDHPGDGTMTLESSSPALVADIALSASWFPKDGLSTFLEPSEFMQPNRWLQAVVISRGSEDYVFQVIQVSQRPKLPSDKMKYTAKLVNLDETTAGHMTNFLFPDRWDGFRNSAERAVEDVIQSFAAYLVSTGGRVYDKENSRNLRLMMVADKLVAYDMTQKWIGGVSDVTVHVGSDLAVSVFRVKGHLIDKIVMIRFKYGKGEVSDVDHSLREGYTEDMQFSTTDEFGEFFSLKNTFQMGTGSIEVDYIHGRANLTVRTNDGFQQAKHEVSSPGLVAEVTLPTNSVKTLVVLAGEKVYVFQASKALPMNVSSSLVSALKRFLSMFGLARQFVTTMVYHEHHATFDETTVWSCFSRGWLLHLTCCRCQAREMANLMIQGCSDDYANDLQVSFAKYLVSTGGQVYDKAKTRNLRLMMFTDKLVAYDMTQKWIGGVSDVTVHVGSDLAVSVFRVKGHSSDKIVMIRIRHGQGEVSEVDHSIHPIGIIKTNLQPANSNRLGNMGSELKACYPGDSNFGTTYELGDFFSGKTTVQMGKESIEVDYKNGRPTLTVWNATDEERVTHDVSSPVLVADVQVSPTHSVKAVVVSAGGEDYVFLTSHDPTKTSDDMEYTAKRVNFDEQMARRVTHFMFATSHDRASTTHVEQSLSGYLSDKDGRLAANYDSNCNMRLLLVETKLIAYNMSEKWIGGISAMGEARRYNFFEVTGRVRGAATNGHSFEKSIHLSVFMKWKEPNAAELKRQYYETIAGLLKCVLLEKVEVVVKFLESTSGVIRDKDGRGLRLYDAFNYPTKIHRLHAWSLEGGWKGDLELSDGVHWGCQDCDEQIEPTAHTHYIVKVEDCGIEDKKIVISCTTQGEEGVEVTWRMMD
eukprot:GHVS01023533.1.p1 GENE.GHVS01023533.1~~GHVS01023533.1.p1  ORF type:complete len:939 (+),score=57.74 GHVS01023533.1:298-3114(+)